MPTPPHDDLDAFFKPASLAIVGASDRPGSVGALTTRNVIDAGFPGPLFLVNRARRRIAGRRAFADVKGLPSAPDLAVVIVPPQEVVRTIGELAEIGTKAAVVITAGFAELGDEGRALQRAMIDRAHIGGLRILGPNCIGLVVPHARLNASFAPSMPSCGGVALVSQSGAMLTALVDWARPHRVGFSHVVSLGDMADVDFGDVIAYLDRDPETKVIACYVEGISDAPKFVAAATAAARSKPLLVLKVGRNPQGARAVRSHTGAIAGADTVYDAALRRCGVTRVQTLADLLDALETSLLAERVTGSRLCIVTNGGGPGVLATDALMANGGSLATLDARTLARLDALLPATWSRRNPVDMIGDATPETYRAVTACVLGDPNVEALLVLNAPTGMAHGDEAARAVVAARGAVETAGSPPVLTCWLGEESAEPARRIFAASGIPTYETPESAVRGFMQQQPNRERDDRREAEACAEPSPADIQRVAELLLAARASGRMWLDPDDAVEVLRAYGIPTVRSRSVTTSEEAAATAAAFGTPVALKIRSREVTHKSDVGGVALDLEGSDAVREAAHRMLADVRAAVPSATIDGLLVQEMVRRPAAIELIAGASTDPVFGPVMLFGAGGVAVQLLDDTSLEFPPLDRPAARALIARTRIARRLSGYRGTPAADVDAIADVLVRLSRVLGDQESIGELDINPLLADAAGVLAVDVRIALASAPRPAPAFARGAFAANVAFTGRS